MKVDVLIAGGGPAGLSIARVLAEEGVDVAICEKRRIGETTKTWLCWEDMIERRFKECIIHKAKKVILRAGPAYASTRDRYVLLNEERILKSMAYDVESSGGILLEREGFLNFMRKNGLVLQTTRRLINAQLLLDATGFDSWMARALNPNMKEIFYDCYGRMGRGYDRDEGEVVIAERLMNGSGSYGWFDPFGGGRGFAGIFFLSEWKMGMGSLRRTFSHYIKMLGKRTVKGKEKYGQIRIGMLERRCTDEMMLVGDSAGWAPPVSGVGFKRVFEISRPLSMEILRVLGEEDLSRESLEKAYDNALNKIPYFHENQTFQLLGRNLAYAADDELCQAFVRAFSRVGNEIQKNFYRACMTSSQIKKLLWRVVEEAGLRGMVRLLKGEDYSTLLDILTNKRSSL